MNKFKKISTGKFELKGKQTLIASDKAQNITGGKIGGGAVFPCGE